jgi:hypothetical protein
MYVYGRVRGAVVGESHDRLYDIYQCRLILRKKGGGLTSSLLHDERRSRLQPIICEKRSSWKVRINLLLDGLDFDFIVVDDGPCCVIGVSAAYHQCWVYFGLTLCAHNFGTFTGGIGRGTWKIHLYSGLIHLPFLLFCGIVSYVGELVWLEEGASADCVAFGKGAAYMPSTKQMITTYERKSIEENISRWQTSQVDELDREGIPEALMSSD